jgi:hypothetical protein
MVHPFAPFGQIAGDGTVRIDRPDQFDPASASVEGRHLDCLVWEGEALTSGEPKRPVARDCLIQVCYDDGNVMQRRMQRSRARIAATAGHGG